MAKKIAKGFFVKVPNEHRKFGSALKYWGQWGIWKGKPTPMLFTEAAVLEAIERAEHQPEDVPKLSIWTRVFG